MIHSLNILPALSQPSATNGSLSPATRQQDSSSNKTAVANNKMDRYSPVGVVESSDNTDVTYDQKSRVETSAQTVMVEERYHPLAEVKKSPSLPLDIYQPIGEVGNGKPETAAGSIVALVSEQV